SFKQCYFRSLSYFIYAIGCGTICSKQNFTSFCRKSKYRIAGSNTKNAVMEGFCEKPIFNVGGGYILLVNQCLLCIRLFYAGRRRSRLQTCSAYSFFT